MSCEPIEDSTVSNKVINPPEEHPTLPSKETTDLEKQPLKSNEAATAQSTVSPTTEPSPDHNKFVNVVL